MKLSFSNKKINCAPRKITAARNKKIWFCQEDNGILLDLDLFH